MKLRIGINSEPRQGPHGGANQFAKTVHNHLEKRGHEVYRHLVPDLDLLLVVNANSNISICSFDYEDIRDYISLNPQTAVVLRVNTCDEQRGERYGNNEAMFEGNKLSDVTVFVSEFLRTLYTRKGMDVDGKSRVIRNGADPDVFDPEGRSSWNPDENLKIVTHHWSNNFMKGFDIYERLDTVLGYDDYAEKFDFTYIGRTPLGVDFENTNLVDPLSGDALVDMLKQHHAYVTGARNEAGPNHVVEGLQCGLPMLYLDTGALPEYSHPYGIEFDLANFEEKILELRERYPKLREKVLEADAAHTRTVQQYEQLFLDVVERKRTSEIPEPSFLERARIKYVDRPYRSLQDLYHMSRIGWRYFNEQIR